MKITVAHYNDDKLFGDGKKYNYRYRAQEYKTLNRKDNLHLDLKNFICGNPNRSGHGKCTVNITCRGLNSTKTGACFIQHNSKQPHTCSLGTVRINLTKQSHPKYKPSKILKVDPVAIIASQNSSSNGQTKRSNNGAINPLTVNKKHGKQVGQAVYQKHTIILHKMLDLYHQDNDLQITLFGRQIYFKQILKKITSLPKYNLRKNTKQNQYIFAAEVELKSLSSFSSVVRLTNSDPVKLKRQSLNLSIFVPKRYLRKYLNNYIDYLDNPNKKVQVFIRSIIPYSHDGYYNIALDTSSFNNIWQVRHHFDIRTNMQNEIKNLS